MSLKAMVLVWEHSTQDGTALNLMLALADHANDKLFCWPSMKTLGEKIRRSERQTRTLLRQLEEAGEITSEARMQPDGQTSNLYTITIRQAPPEENFRPAPKTSATPGSPPPPPPEVATSANPSSEPSVESSPVVPAGDATAIYNAYPRRVKKPAALRAISKALGFVSPEILIEKTRSFAAATAKWPPGDEVFIPHPSTWFNNECFNDDPSTWERAMRNKSPTDERKAQHAAEEDHARQRAIVFTA